VSVPEASPTAPKQEPRLAEAERELIARKARKEDKKEANHESVKAIIDLFGGMARLQQAGIRVEISNLMPSCIEYLGTGLRGGVLLSIAHYHLQNGDLFADPELVVAVIGEDWHPVTYQQDNGGLYHEAVYEEDGQVMLRPRLIRELQQFMTMWDSNVKNQGYIDAARRACSDKQGEGG
jgi:hypothetical protein